MAAQPDVVQQNIQAGGQVSGNAGDLLAAARSLGYAVFEIDCDRAKSKSAVLRAIATAVDFPEYFGGNLDALLDCLTSTVLDQAGTGALFTLGNLHEEEPGVAEHLDDILQTFADAADYVQDNGKVIAFARV
jgi:RNAse (barnase) inhibitor barstar